MPSPSPSSRLPHRLPSPPPPVDEEILRKPWKYLGYRSYSSFLASDDNFLVFRRFGDLNARVLLYLQDQIVRLEERLEELDTLHSAKTAPDIHNGSFRLEPVPERSKILEELHPKLKEYNALLIQHSTLRSRPKVPKWDTESLRNWHANTQNVCIHAPETAYITHDHDLISLVPRATTPLRHFLEHSSRFRLARIWRKRAPSHLANHATAQHPLSETLHFSSDSRIDRTITMLITAAGMAMLIAPLWVLAVTKGPNKTIKRLGIITGFVAVFLVLISLTTVAKPFESLAAAAA
ncbi:uncharacterized protein EI97DRAFT_463847 [Westerdykella ornata]|uniref:DUF6594 domain-containing protein n=1 Tax=Westerdykella ornata TaxID=318751 RepID=A0A6A6JYQ2_WESOR|nr:uncharacterized protein EI97DRAFT_463847 [Westerdykella ornata]KAF2281537.1 hypothetical protein EI97DRAFT_463847 [Westerdykella ornata]